MDLKTELQTEASRLGFALFGVTTPAPPQSMPIYLAWLEAGRHGNMAYLATDRAVERRGDPFCILPETKSIIVLGIRYPQPNVFPTNSGSELEGRVAAYARGQDYHEIIPPRLEKLAVFMQLKTGTPVISRAYTDTGPILERDLASRAGIGWIGKNSCLIDPQSGSFFLLAELFSNVELEPDQPFTMDYCGSCQRCIEACPTQCILPDRTIDARRCISYLTIENKGSIPVSLRPQLGNWVFGCDVCQQVCPWNIRFASDQIDADLHPNKEIAHPILTAELHLSPQDFNRKFKKSPVQRARRRGYLRNIAVALGNSGSPEAIPALAETLESEPEPLIRAHAAWALGQIGTQNALLSLRKTLMVETNPMVLDEINIALK
ncbi:MAG: tRNA epoxyqueuosine(34) reductase QueG [Bellilinea sp.]